MSDEKCFSLLTGSAQDFSGFIRIQFYKKPRIFSVVLIIHCRVSELVQFQYHTEVADQDTLYCPIRQSGEEGMGRCYCPHPLPEGKLLMAFLVKVVEYLSKLVHDVHTKQLGAFDSPQKSGSKFQPKNMMEYEECFIP